MDVEEVLTLYEITQFPAEVSVEEAERLASESEADARRARSMGVNYTLDGHETWSETWEPWLSKYKQALWHAEFMRGIVQKLSPRTL